MVKEGLEIYPASQTCSDNGPGQHTAYRYRQTIRHHDSEQMASIGPKRHSHPKITFALRDRIGHDSVESNRRQQQCDSAKNAEKSYDDLLRSQRLAVDVCQISAGSDRLSFEQILREVV